jgi:hypothetical protein
VKHPLHSLVDLGLQLEVGGLQIKKGHVHG